MCVAVQAKSQLVLNDNCNSALLLPNIEDECTPVGKFTTVGATASSQPSPGCFSSGPSLDVWFAFRATHLGVSIRIIGGTAFFSGGTLRRPQAGLYSGDCDNLTLLDCNADEFSSVISDYTQVATLQSTSLNVGETYFFRVSGQNGNTGTFQLCITSFDPVPPAQSDCATSVLLCDKKPFIVPFLTTNGRNRDEVQGAPCDTVPKVNCDYEELQSAWYKWICKDPGTLTLTLTPLNPVDDLDFWIYELPNGVNDCNAKLPLMCMAAGMIQGQAVSAWIRCHGPTGLRNGETDDHENCGCDAANNNFIKPLQMEAGKAYALVIMNFSQTSDGFSISFGGTGTFVGPDINFTFDPELNNKCDVDTIYFTDQSISGIGNISKYEWNFGAGAKERTSDKPGPHIVVYESFGNKNIVLRITTTAGCAVTEIRQMYIEPCCDPARALTLDVLEVLDPLCPGTNSGAFTLGGSAGSPYYLFSTNGIDFTPITQYNGLASGNYRAYIQDIKGCLDSADIQLKEPPPFDVDAGPDQTIELGYDTDLRATVFTSQPLFTVEWQTHPSLGCTDCLDPRVTPTATTTYTITITNPVGCRATDSVTVNVNVVRPVYIPSAFSPNDDGINDFFTAFGGRQARQIKRLLIFDRWGDLLFQGRDLPLSETRLGWNGTFRGKRMDPAVFTYFIEVEFIDGAVLPYEGDVTLIR
jgi:gliding motility-associated-like protein